MRVAVVGGGHAGLLASLALALAGHKVVLYEEHNNVGRPPHCTGVVSREYISFIKKLGINPERLEARRYKGVRITVKDVEIARLKAEVYKVNRIKLEEEILAAAMKEGVDVKLKTKVKSVGTDGLLRHSGTSETFDGIVVAEGWRASLLKRAGLPVAEPLKARGLNYLLDKPSSNEFITVDVSNASSTCFFSWRIPLGTYTLEGQASRFKNLVPPKEAREVHGGIILLGPPKPLLSGKLLSFGDASRLVKPLTGGGLAAHAEAIRIYLDSYSGGREKDPLKTLYQAQLRIAAKLAASYPLALKLYKDCMLNRLVKIIELSPLNVEFNFDHHVSIDNLTRLLSLRLVKTSLTYDPKAAFTLATAIIKGLSLAIYKNIRL